MKQGWRAVARCRRGLGLVAVVGAGVAFGAMWGADWLVERASRDGVYTEVRAVPERDVGLVLGCARTVADGRENLFFRYRIERAAELFHAGKVRFLLVSGDNSRVDYDEPTAMRAALVERGVPAERIVCDYAGFSTLDSIVRAREVFGQDRVTVISQDFHVRRALYIAQGRGVDAIAVPARDVSGRFGWRTHLREYLARVKTVLDLHVWQREPHFLGEPVAIGETADAR